LVIAGFVLPASLAIGRGRHKTESWFADDTLKNSGKARRMVEWQCNWRKTA
jgi:hypothetical protein